MRHSETGRTVIGLRNNGFTWLGLVIVVLGWALLLASLLISDATLKAGNLVAAMTTRGDIVTIAQTGIVSGLGIAIIGALHSGFGAFGRFFDAVLQRSVSPRRDLPVEPSAPTVSVSSVDRGTAPPMPPPPLRPKDKNYVTRPDGSVEVETLFGPRVFATMEEAREFIR